MDDNIRDVMFCEIIPDGVLKAHPGFENKVVLLRPATLANMHTKLQAVYYASQDIINQERLPYHVWVMHPVTARCNLP